MAELTIYGDSARWLVEQGIKLLTLRLNDSKYDDLQPGETVIINYQGERGIGIVFSRQLKPVGDYTPAELLLDGYLSTTEAVKDLKSYPRYEGVTPKTSMLGIGVTSQAHYFAYLNEADRDLLQKTPLHQAVLLPKLHGFFLPAYLWWAILKEQDNGRELTVAKWHRLLSSHLGIFTQEYLRKVSGFDPSTQRFYEGLSPKDIKGILKYKSTESLLYRSVVLCQPLSIKG